VVKTLIDEVLRLVRTSLPTAPQLTDAQLLRRFVEQREEAAFAALLQRHGPMVLGVCRRVLRHQQDAEDAFQATFLVLARRAGAIRSRPQLAGWLYGVAYRTARHARRLACKRRARERQVANMPEPAVVMADAWNDLQPVLDEELARLPDRYRAALVLCDLEGKTRPEVARELGCPEGTVSSRLARARRRLAQRLTRRGVTLSAGALATVLVEHATASVPPALGSAIVQAASLSGAAPALAAGLISARVAALTEGVIKAMFLTPLKVFTAVLLVLGLVALAGLLNGIQAVESPFKTDDIKTGAILLDGVSADEPAHGAKGQVNSPAPGEQKPDAKAAGVQKAPKAKWAEVATFRMIDDGDVTAVVFSPDGKMLAAGATPDNVPVPRAGVVKVWDIAAGQQSPLLKDHTFFLQVSAVAYSPDGKTLAVGALDPSGIAKPAKQVTLWDTATGKKSDTLPGFGPLAFAPDGKTLACADNDYRLVIWEIASGKELTTLKGHTGLINSLAFSADGRILASASNDGTARVWDPATGQERFCFKAKAKYRISAMALSCDGKLLATVAQLVPDKPGTMVIAGEIALWDTHTGKPIRAWEDEAGPLAAAFSPDGTLLATGGYDGLVKVWDVATGVLRTSLKGHTKYILTLAFTKDGTLLASGSWDGTVKVWRVEPGAAGPPKLEGGSLAVPPPDKAAPPAASAKKSKFSELPPIQPPSGTIAPTPWPTPFANEVKLAPGPHHVRVALPLGRMPDPLPFPNTLKGIRPLSKMVTITIQHGQAKAEPPDWGAAVAGVQIRLRPDKVAWAAGEVPTFHVDVRNQSQEAFDGCRIAQGCEIEIDGQWYLDFPSPVDCPASRLNAGAHIDDWLHFSLGHLLPYKVLSE
jgi:RNA polymerase sigma factor (sigma-70 family)